MELKNLCESYFNHLDQLWNQQAADSTAQVYKALKVLACLTLYIPAVFLYRMADLYGRITHHAEINAQESRITRMGTEALQNERAQRPFCINTVHPYPGDLTVEQKSSIRTELRDQQTLKINFLNNPGIEVTIRRQNIFQSGAQVIVNAANTSLGGGGGIDGAIHNFGGNGYVQAHRQLKERYLHSERGSFTSGYAAAIESGLLKDTYQIDKVIVVAGPIAQSTPENDAALYSCYYNALILASWENYTNLAFPSISTGIFGFPKERAAAISLKALHDFIQCLSSTSLRYISIHFLENEPFENLQNYIDATL